MRDGPPPPPPNGAVEPYLFGLIADVGELKARVAVVERSVPELSARLDGRFAALEAQVARTQDHLAQQDQQQAAFRLEVKSTLGTLASGLGALQQAEQGRAAEAHEAAERAREAQERATELAGEQRTELRRWAMQTVASMVLTLPGVLWPLIVTRPLALRLGVPAACITLVLLLAAWAWARSRR